MTSTEYAVLFGNDYTPEQRSDMAKELIAILQRDDVNYTIIDNETAAYTGYNNYVPSSTRAVVTRAVVTPSPVFEFVDILDTEVAQGPNIIQWNINKDELTTKRMAAINDIIKNTISNNP